MWVAVGLGGGVFYKQPVSNHLPAELRPVHRISHYSEIFAPAPAVFCKVNDVYKRSFR